MQTRNNGLRIQAIEPDIEKIKTNEALRSAGLKVVERNKYKPRLIIYGVPIVMTHDDIKNELILQNLCGIEEPDVKVVYVYPRRDNKSTTNCVIETSPKTRLALKRKDRIYLRFSACRYADHIRILQCYRCLSFGHMARECKGRPACGHCGRDHESKDCPNRNSDPVCGNCRRVAGQQATHAAIDSTKCPLLLRKIRDRVTLIDYDGDSQE